MELKLMQFSGLDQWPGMNKVSSTLTLEFATYDRTKSPRKRHPPYIILYTSWLISSACTMQRAFSLDPQGNNRGIYYRSTCSRSMQFFNFLIWPSLYCAQLLIACICMDLIAKSTINSRLTEWNQLVGDTSLLYACTLKMHSFCVKSWFVSGAN